VRRRALASRLTEEWAELAAGGIERSLLILAAVIQERASILNHFEKVFFNGLFS
jgi:hypothetical protein